MSSVLKKADKLYLSLRKTCYHGPYIEISIFPHTDNTQPTGHK